METLAQANHRYLEEELGSWGLLISPHEIYIGFGWMRALFFAVVLFALR